MINNNTSPTPGMAFKVLTIIHLALMLGQVLFGVVVFFQTRSVRVNIEKIDDVYIYIVPFMAISCFIASNFMYKQQLGIAAGKPTLQEKMTGYQTALIVRYALLEGASLFGIVVYLLTGNLLFLLISGAIVIYFLLIRPTRDRVEADLNLTYEEKIDLDSRDTFGQ
ncbi:MAG: hypothetical protein V4592_24270 [Bacteroidota bacterium]